jgi:hypothetical protein
LWRKSTAPRLRAIDSVAGLSISAHDDHRNVLRFGGHPQPLQHLDSGASRHVDIEQNQLWSGTQGRHPRLQRVDRKDWLKFARTEERGQQLTLEARVVGDQNLGHEELGPDEARPSGDLSTQTWINVSAHVG